VAPAYGSATPRAYEAPANFTSALANAMNSCAASAERTSGRYPDVILMDAPTGNDPLAEAAINDLSDFTFLFAKDTQDTWATYRRMFTALLVSGQAPALREQFRVVSAMSPGTGADARTYPRAIREQSWDTFSVLYDDDVPDPVTGQLSGNVFHPPLEDESAPHYPLPILLLPSLLSVDTAALDDGWQDGVFTAAAFEAFVPTAAALITAATMPAAAM
jgi:hypothetical protein